MAGKRRSRLKTTSIFNKAAPDENSSPSAGDRQGYGGKTKEDKKNKGEVDEVMEDCDEILYEVEAIRKKRYYKGRIQCLIKWLNYPETDNTWEPYENVKHCIDELEIKRLKIKTALPQRKSSIQIDDHRDGATTHTKGEENSPLSPMLSKERARSKNSRLARTKFLSQKPESSHDKKKEDVPIDKKGKEKIVDGEVILINEIYIDLPKVQQRLDVMNMEGGTNLFMQDYVRKWREKEEAKGGVGAAAMSIFFPNYKENIEGQGKDPSRLLPKGLIPSFPSEPEHEASKDGNKLTGAMKRKLGRVRRFVHPDELDKKAMNLNLEDAKEAIASTAVPDSTSIDTNNKMAKEELHITKILKEVQYTAASSPSADCNLHVCTTFIALRSDGTKVLVSNNELRVTNPLLLADFYEQHLHCTPNP